MGCNVVMDLHSHGIKKRAARRRIGNRTGCVEYSGLNFILIMDDPILALPT